jgi:hypothetical protein
VNIHKNMEAIFVIVLAAIGLGSYLLEFLPDAQATQPTAIARNIATPTSMAVVIVSAPRAQSRK